MIKRRFYRIEHANGNDDASDSSSDSKIEAEAEAEEETSAEEASENDVKGHNESSTSSGNLYFRLITGGEVMQRPF
ncbi:hypothetical protein AAG906_039716 [Vitis piasezkii]